MLLSIAGPTYAQPQLDPLAGNYDVGGGAMDFPDVISAALALAENGVTGPTIMRVFAGTYEGMVMLSNIDGASETSTIIFVRADSLTSVTLYASSGDSAVVVFAGAAFVTFDGIDVAAGSNVARGVIIGSGSHHITLLNGGVSGTVSTSSDGIRLRGPGCNHNRFENLAVRGFGDAFDLDGLTVANSVNLIRGCRVDSVRRGIVAYRQDRLLIDRNDISVNAGSVEEVDGIYIGTIWPQDSVTISANMIHAIAVNGAYAAGLRIKPDSAQAVVRVCNNFIYDFQNSGNSQIRALYVSSGDVACFANNLNLNNTAATGSSYGLYLATFAANGRVALYNNILVNREAADAAYNIFCVSTGINLASDYNIVNGTGNNYHVGRFGTDCDALADWQLASGADTHSLSGDPGYLSETDLHLSPLNGLAHLNGAVIPELISDIDGQIRQVPPDRGADEYEFLAPDNDVAVLGFHNVAAAYPEFSTVDVAVILQNRGTLDQRETFVQLYFNEEACAEAVVRIDASRTDTVMVPWPTPSAGNAGMLRARCSVSEDAVPQNDTAAVFVTIVPAPLSGNYSIDSEGGGYTSFTEAVNDLVLRGVSGPVTFYVVPGTYGEALSIGTIAGASGTNRITFARDPLARTEVILTSDVAPAVLWLAGAHFVTFDNIHITAVAPCPTAVLLSNDADSNRLVNAAINGSSLFSITSHGIHLLGGGNDDNVFENLTFNGATEAIHLEGNPQWPDLGTIVRQCLVSSSRFAVHTAYQDNLLLTQNTFQTGYDGALQPCVGVLISAQNPADSLRIERNYFIGGRADASCYGIRCESESGLNLINNNFFSAWNVSAGEACAIAAVSGTIDASFNSIWMNDVSASSVAAVTDSGAELSLRNNIVYVSESDSPATCLNWHAGPLLSDYNCFYGDTTNNRFSLAAGPDADYASWFAWNSATGLDSHSVVGDPQFVSPTDLHIVSDAGLVSGAGVTVAGIAADIDNDLRNAPPDIGADEYDLMSITNDVRLLWIAQPDTLFNADTSYAFSICVINSGDSAQPSVPVSLLFDNVLQDEHWVSLPAGDTATVNLTWTTPNVGLMFSGLEIICDLPGDQLPLNNSLELSVTVVGPPMSGEYVVGGADELPSLAVVAQHLLYRGVSAPVTFSLLPGQYVERVRFFPVPGASAAAPIVIESLNDAVLLRCDSGSAVVEFNGADHFTLRGLAIQAVEQCPGAVLLHSGADSNLIENCALRSSDSLHGATYGVRIELDGNDHNTLHNLTIDGAFIGVALQNGPSAAQSIGNEIRACMIRHARFGIYVDNQIACAIHECDLQPGSPSPVAAACYGIYVAALGTGGSVAVFNNRIHGFADASLSTSNRAVGIYSSPAAGAAALIYNNFIYDFAAVAGLKLNGLYLSQGSNTVLHNSIRINNSATNNEIAGVYISSGNEQWIRNNIVVCDEADVPSVGILSNSSAFASDYNDIYGAGPFFAVAQVAGTTYASLVDWQSTGSDSHSISADPGFISDQDLHISPTDSTAGNRGLYSSLVQTDIDLDLRLDPPDLGADEYTVGTPPPAVTDVTIIRRSSTVLLRWPAVVGATAYRVYASSTPDVQPILANLVATVATTHYVDANLNLTSRFYIITAVSSP